MICVPWMLFVKPFLLYKKMKKETLHKKLDYEVELADLHREPV